MDTETHRLAMTEFETPENTLLCRFSKGEIKSVSIRMSKTTLDMAFGCGEKNTRIIWTLRSHFLHFLIMKLDKIACRSVLFWRIPKQFIFFWKMSFNNKFNFTSIIETFLFYNVTLHPRQLKRFGMNTRWNRMDRRMHRFIPGHHLNEQEVGMFT